VCIGPKEHRVHSTQALPSFVQVSSLDDCRK